MGNYTDARGLRLPMAETWSGTSWVKQDMPIPTGGTGAAVFDVSCVSAAFCMAGSFNPDSTAVVDELFTET